jgi:serine/threonine protein phosphatase 1
MGKVVIGDVHGSYLTLMALIEKIKAQFPEDEIVFCGDLIDRGPRSRQVVEYIINNNLKTVKGNHEDMMVIDTLDKPSPYKGGWINREGIETIRSYWDADLEINSQLMRDHAEWMEKLPVYLEFPDVKDENGRYLVVSHSNVGAVWRWAEDKRKECKDIFENYIMWERYGQKDNEEIYNVTGHTPQPDGPRIRSFYACIDTGACFNRPHYGRLTALQYPSLTIIQQENIDYGK